MNYKEWFEKNKEHMKAYHKRYYLNNKEKYRLRNIGAYYKLEPWERTLISIKSRLRDKRNSLSKYYLNKGIKNYLTKDDLKYLWIRDNASKLKDPTIHRKNSNKHYTIENCQYIERIEHILKSHFLKISSKWCKKYDKCIICNTAKMKHASKGLCQTCYSKKLWRKKE